MKNYLFLFLIIYAFATLSCSDITLESKIKGRAFEFSDDFSTRPLEQFPIYFFKEETLNQFSKYFDVAEKKVEEKKKSSLEKIKNHLKTINIKVGKEVSDNIDESSSDYNERINRANESTDKINAFIDEIETKEDALERWPVISNVLSLSKSLGNVSFENYLAYNMLPPLDVHPYHETLLVEFCNQYADEIILTDFYGQFNVSKKYDFIIAFYNSSSGAKIWKKPIRQSNEINISTKNFNCDNYKYFVKFMINNPKEETFVLGFEF